MSLVVAMVGTDHHPFDRLVDWIDDAARRHPDTRFIVQHGESKPPEVAEGHAYLPHERITELLAEAVGAVVHGGPGTIMDARGAGHVPICVPRDPSLGEHVDGHQQRFAALVGPAGVVTDVRTAEEFQAALDAVLAAGDSARVRALPESAATAAARSQLALELDALLEARPRGLLRGRRARMAGLSEA